MSDERVERRLAAIFAADVAGYSRLMGEDEAGTLARLRTVRRDLIDPKVAEHKGRIVKTTGDGILVEFPSVVEAVACAVGVQREMARKNCPIPPDSRIVFRIGINLGDVIVEDGDIHGDGVNVAARLEALAEPGGVCISGVVHDQVQGRLEIGFTDSGEQSLKNIARPVRVYRVELDKAANATAAPPSLPAPDKPSIAVMPFQNMSGDPEQEYFADGMVEEIITALSRIRWLFVIARTSTFTYKGQTVGLKRVGRELGVRYVLEGSVRKAGGRVRITAQLIESETGTHLWADRFDGLLEDVFDLQDQIAANVAGVIEPALQAAETDRVVRHPTNDPTAYDLYLRASTIVTGSSTKTIQDALSLLEQAIARDPNYGPALGLAAVCYHRFLLDGRSDEAERDRKLGTEFARRALQCSGEDPGVLVNAAMALSVFGEDIDAMVGLAERAVSLNPSFARGWYVVGMLRTWAGQPEEALMALEKAQQLAPRGRIGYLLVSRALAYCVMRRFEEAIRDALLAIQEDPTRPPSYRILAASYALTGRLNEARATIKQLCVVAPSRAAAAVITGWRDCEQREMYLSGLRLAVTEEA
jgi:TolB-like protein